MGAFDDARNKAEELIGNLAGDDEQRRLEAEKDEAEAEHEKEEILGEAQEAADWAREQNEQNQQ